MSEAKVECGVSTEQKAISLSAEEARLLVNPIAKAAAMLNLRAAAVILLQGLSTEEMEKRLDAALAALRGETPDAIDEKPREVLSIEAQLRKDNRIQDNPEILAKIGFKGQIPEIPAELIEECARTNGTVVLRFKTTVTELQSNVESALGNSKMRLHMYVDSAAKALAITSNQPEWVNVPNKVVPNTLLLAEHHALASIPGSNTSDPMNTILMLSYNNVDTKEQLPGFKNRWTYTDLKNTLVGSCVDGISVVVVDDGDYSVGLAPRFAPKSKN